jgi:hypothetical protein
VKWRDLLVGVLRDGFSFFVIDVFWKAVAAALFIVSPAFHYKSSLRAPGFALQSGLHTQNFAAIES